MIREHDDIINEALIALAERTAATTRRENDRVADMLRRINREIERQHPELVVIDHMTGARAVDLRPDDDVIDQKMRPVRLFGPNVIPFRQMRS